MQKLKPDMYRKNIFDINYDKIFDIGIRYLFFDLDNTLISYKDKEINSKLIKLFESLKNKGFEIFIFSNSSKKRLGTFIMKNDIGIYYSSMKPLNKNYKKVLKKYEKEKCAFIGDQIMTDVIGAKRNGFFVIFVDKMDSDEPFSTKFLRFFEKFILKNFEKNKILEKGKYYD